MLFAPWCHKCIICDILQFRGCSIAYMLTAACSGMFEKYISLMDSVWNIGAACLNFYTGPKMERLERGWYPLFWIQTGARQTIIVYKSSHECQESVVLAISFNCDNISTIFFFMSTYCVLPFHLTMYGSKVFKVSFFDFVLGHLANLI